MSENLVILFSGGADSRLMVEMAIKAGKKPYGVLVNYGQLHGQELESASAQLNKLQIPHRVVSIENLGVNSGLTGSGEKNETGQVHEMYVPGRNTMFISIAFSIAESMNIDTIWIGSDWSDRLGLFPDCYQEYFVRVNEMLKYGGPKEIKVEAPLLGISKELAITLLKGFGIKEEEYFSGYGDL